MAIIRNKDKRPVTDTQQKTFISKENSDKLSRRELGQFFRNNDKQALLHIVNHPNYNLFSALYK
jgi:hypothetical protein